MAEATSRGHDVVGVSRSGPVRADVTTGEGLAAAFDGAQVVIDATNTTANLDKVLVDGTRRVLETAAKFNVKHFVGISIVGIDDSPIAYYRAKQQQEKVIEASPIPWTLLRATQFHDLVPKLVRGALGIGIVPREFPIQPIDTRDVAPVLIDAAERPAAGRLPDVGGPEVHQFKDLARAWDKAAGKKRLLLAVPIPGAQGRFLREGRLCTTPDRRVGTRTFAAWLAQTYRAR